ncbi:hypothetical protein [Corynebacterium sp. CNJ-954]|uniref:phage terminase small subunit n=1 Tax=Corynebacterium sp. CNJ-954 TaxID=1904962 RepID=UPI00096A6A11|nr:hypothetical protein [Corynebacterium sp. CNJ-954]
MHVVEVEPGVQPSLEDLVGDVNPVTGEPFTPMTLRFWEELSEFATLGLLLDAQWSLLARAMVLDDAVMRGEAKWAAEARLQMAKFGIAPDDVLRMRVQIVQADEAEAKSEVASGASAGRRGIRAVK